MGPTYKIKQYRNIEQLKKDFFSLFWCQINISKFEFDKLTEYEVNSLIIRGNCFVFENNEWR